MCDLLGMSFNRSIKIEWSFKWFSHRGGDNRDRWGIATHLNGGPAAQIMKEPFCMDGSRLAGHMVFALT